MCLGSLRKWDTTSRISCTSWTTEFDGGLGCNFAVSSVKPTNPEALKLFDTIPGAELLEVAGTSDAELLEVAGTSDAELLEVAGTLYAELLEVAGTLDAELLEVVDTL